MTTDTRSPTPAPTATPDGATLQALLGADARPRRRTGTWLVAAALLAAAVAAAAWWWNREVAAARPRYDSVEAIRGSLTVTVTATGTVQPLNQVAVGSELSGTVTKVNVDVNDRVRPGQVLVELDTTRLASQVAGDEAAVSAAQAALRQAEAARAEATATLQRFEAVHRASAGQVPAAAELDGARTALDRALAAEASAQAGIAQASAQLRANQTNLRKTQIRSPIDGIVLARSVDPGNAVAASLQAVTLFTLADDLSRMRLRVNVDEADVGQVREGQTAAFTVAAWPNRRYPATVTRVGYGPTTKDNVVTYLADLSVDNRDLSLRPGMTATAVITTLERGDALLVPNAALRWNPDAAAAEAAGSGGLVSRLVPRPPTTGPRRVAGTDISRVRQVWVLENGEPVAVPVTPGASDGRRTEVTSERLQPGMAVIVGRAIPDARP